MDPDAVVQCPYDRNHQVRESRLPYHLVRCQQNNPQVSRTLATCPFNARHRVPRALLRAHVASCPDKLPLELPPDPEEGHGQDCPHLAAPPVPGGLGRRAERAGAGGAAPVHPPGHQGGTCPSPATGPTPPRPRRGWR
ncbi:gametocyte-specific factor 1 [Melospiza melodia melodia]|uniref:gametocyte-specific factor 1 n=1 Tax=Melospiza melodia melodia TaxID=1914991 RepID=UPI002FD44013